jgi:hypothetical protein
VPNHKKLRRGLCRKCLPDSSPRRPLVCPRHQSIADAAARSEAALVARFSARSGERGLRPCGRFARECLRWAAGPPLGPAVGRELDASHRRAGQARRLRIRQRRRSDELGDLPLVAGDCRMAFTERPVSCNRTRSPRASASLRERTLTW